MRWWPVRQSSKETCCTLVCMLHSDWSAISTTERCLRSSTRPLDQLAKYTCIALIATALLRALFLVLSVLDLGRLIDFAGGDTEDAAQRAADLRRYFNRIDAFAWPVFLATAGLSIAWFHRAYTNLRAIQRSALRPPNWAIFSWFVPIANLWVPLQLTRELSPDVYADDDDPRPTDRLIGRWWVLFVGAGIAALVLSYIDARETYDQIAWVVTDMAVSLVDIAAAILAIAL